MSVGMVIPTLGERLELLDLTMASILGQEDVDVRVVIVTPESRVGALRQRYPDVSVEAEPGGGIAKAITHGWAVLGAVDAIAWLGDDDLLEPRSLARATRALDHDRNVALVYGRCRYIDFDGGFICEIRPGRIAIPLMRLGRSLIAQPGALYRRTAVVAIGGLDESVRLAFDVDLHLRLAAYGKAAYLPVVLGSARAHPESLTTAQREASMAEAELVTQRARGPLAERTRRLWDAPVDIVKRISYKVSTQRP